MKNECPIFQKHCLLYYYTCCMIPKMKNNVINSRRRFYIYYYLLLTRVIQNTASYLLNSMLNIQKIQDASKI